MYLKFKLYETKKGYTYAGVHTLSHITEVYKNGKYNGLEVVVLKRPHLQRLDAIADRARFWTLQNAMMFAEGVDEEIAKGSRR